MIPALVLLAFVIVGFAFFMYAAFEDMADDNKLLIKQITKLNKEIKNHEKAVKFGIDMSAARIEKLSKLQPMAALEELRAENERNQRLKNV